MTDDVQQLLSWLENVSGSEWIWLVKYLAANDTYAKSHQGGPHLPKELVKIAFPALHRQGLREKNPSLFFEAHLDSHEAKRDVRVVYYNNKIIEGKTRNESRITRWGGKGFPLVAENATGSLVVFAFHKVGKSDADGCRLWICRSTVEEDAVASWVGPIEPGDGVVYSPVGAQLSLLAPSKPDLPCTIAAGDFPEGWLENFPSGESIVNEVLRRLPRSGQKPPDERLVRRRNCEYELFRSVEVAHTLPRIQEGFLSVDIFLNYANSVTNRRKSRAGRSLELHARKIFDEEHVSYSHGEATEEKRTPDFIFPSIQKYHDVEWSAERLRMLAVKTTLKDRWRQVLQEAARVPRKHLLTLQEGVSLPQFREMEQEGVILVVPESLCASYPKAVQPHILNFAQFIRETRAACL